MTVITPNKVEFQRFWKKMFDEEYLPTYNEYELYCELTEDIGEISYSFDNETPTSNEEKIARDTMKVSQKLNGTVVIRKGLIDVISDGNKTFYVKVDGSLKKMRRPRWYPRRSFRNFCLLCSTFLIKVKNFNLNQFLLKIIHY